MINDLTNILPVALITLPISVVFFRIFIHFVRFSLFAKCKRQRAKCKRPIRYPDIAMLVGMSFHSMCFLVFAKGNAVNLLVFVVPLRGYHCDGNHVFIHLIDESVLLIDSSGPMASVIIFEQLRFPYSGIWRFRQFCKNLFDFSYARFVS